MLDHRFFIGEMLQLFHAFGRPLDIEIVVEYYTAFGDLTEPQVQELFRWAIDNIDAYFPRIAALKQHVIARGWYKHAQRLQKSNELVYVICPECGATSVVERARLEQDALASRSYRCINNDLWRCRATISARAILEGLEK